MKEMKGCSIFELAGEEAMFYLRDRKDINVSIYEKRDIFQTSKMAGGFRVAIADVYADDCCIYLADECYMPVGLILSGAAKNIHDFIKDRSDNKDLVQGNPCIATIVVDAKEEFGFDVAISGDACDKYEEIEDMDLSIMDRIEEEILIESVTFTYEAKVKLDAESGHAVKSGTLNALRRLDIRDLVDYWIIDEALSDKYGWDIDDILEIRECSESI